MKDMELWYGTVSYELNAWGQSFSVHAHTHGSRLLIGRSWTSPHLESSLISLSILCLSPPQTFASWWKDFTTLSLLLYISLIYLWHFQSYKERPLLCPFLCWCTLCSLTLKSRFWGGCSGRWQRKNDPFHQWGLGFHQILLFIIITLPVLCILFTHN